MVIAPWLQAPYTLPQTLKCAVASSIDTDFDFVTDN
jgi:hypothetical protein